MADPQFTVVRGAPTAAELAAVIAAIGLLRAAAAQLDASAGAPRSRWAHSARPAQSALPLRRSPDAWRASALPR